MKTHIPNQTKLIWTLLFLLFPLIFNPSFSQTTHPTLPGQVIFLLKQDVQHQHIKTHWNINPNHFDLDEVFIEKYGVTDIRKPYFSFKNDTYLQRLFIISFTKHEEIDRLISEMKKNSSFDFVSRIPQEELTDSPNDPFYVSGDQYHIDLTNVDLAWDLTTGDPNTVVGILDLACEISHPELANKIMINYGEIQSDGIDNDGNGYVDDYYGYSPEHLSGDSIYILPNPLSQTHGTKVTGVIAAITNNDEGIASVGNNISFIPVDVGTDGGSSLGFTGDGFDYLYTRVSELDVINCSFGASYVGFEHLIPAYQAMIDNFTDEGVMIVGSAGNNDDTFVFYPGNLDNAAAVAATKEDDSKHGASCYHIDDIDISAPGATFKSLNTGGGYTGFSHTSAAAPVVSSVFALMRSINPEITVEDMQACMYSTADPTTGAYSDSLGAGRVNALECVLCAEELIAIYASTLEMNNTVELKIYPNPSNEIFNIEISGINDSSLTHFEIYDLQGRLININTVLQPDNSVQITIDQANPNGQYILKLKTTDIVVIRRIILIN